MQPLFSSVIRSRYGMQSFDSNSFHLMVTGNGLSSRNTDSHGLNLTQGDHFPSESGGAVAGEIDNPLGQGDQVIKDAENKHVESPSNP